jgi:hypothetical protein
MMDNTKTTQRHRAYLFYSDSNVSELHFARPGFYKINGTEPTLTELLGGNTIDKSHIGDMGQSGHAGFSHVDNATTTNYAVLQNSSGDTFINAASGQDISFRIDNNDKMIIDSAGNVGIGTTGPSSKLHINNSTVSNKLVEDNVDLLIEHNESRAQLISSNDGTAGSYIALSNAPSSGNQKNWVFHHSGPNQDNKLGIYYKENNTSNTDNLFVFTTVGLTLDTSGNVGIGTTNPTSALHVVGQIDTSEAPVGVHIGTHNNNTYAAIELISSGDTSSWIDFYNTNTSGTTDYTERIRGGLGQLEFYTNEATTQSMTINSSGNVGIGTTNPTERLDVVGNVNISGSLNVDNLRIDGNTLSSVNNEDIIIKPNIQLQNTLNMFRISYENLNDVLTPATEPTTSSYFTFSSWNDNYFPRQFLNINRDTDRTNSGAGPVLGNDLAIEFGYSNYFIRSSDNTFSPVGPAIRFHTSNTEKMCIDYQGNVGIGTTNPQSKLHVMGNILSESLDSDGFGFRRYSLSLSTGSGGGYFKLASFGTFRDGFIHIKMFRPGDYGDFDQNIIEFLYSRRGDSYRCNHKVDGIKSTSLTQVCSLELYNNASTNNDSFQIYFKDVNYQITHFEIVASNDATIIYEPTYQASVDGGYTQVYTTNGSSSNWTIECGYVGIGTANPTERLDVVGNIKASGDLNITGNTNIDGTLNVTGNISGNVTGIVSSLNNHSINALSDVDTTTTAPTDGQALVYDSASSQWQPRSIVTPANADAIQLLNQARYWVVVGDSSNQDRNNNYFLNQVGTGWTTGVDNDGYTWAKGTYNDCKEITDSDAFIAKTDTTLTYAFVADFVIPSTNTNWNVSGEVVVMQEPQETNDRTNHAVLFIHGDNGTNYGQTRGHLLYDNFLPGNDDRAGADESENALMSQMSSYLGQKNLYVITVEPGSTYELKTSFYVNGTFVQSKESNDIYDTTTDTIQSIKIAATRNGNHLGGESKIYGIAAWPRKLSSNEISQLSIPLLLVPKFKTQICGGELGLGNIQSVTASSTYSSDTPATKLFDNVVGGHTTGWHTSMSSSPQYIQIRFYNKRKISTVSMIPRSGFSSQFPKVFSIYGSNDVNSSSIYDISGMNLLFETNGTGYSRPDDKDDYNSSLSAQENIANAVPFNIPESNQEEYYYYTFKFDSSWNDANYIAVISEMFLYESLYESNLNPVIDNLSDIGNVSTTAAINGQPLVYNDTISKWQPGEKLEVNGNMKAGGNLTVVGNTNIGGNLNITGNTNYGDSTRQMINLYNLSYGIGVQGNTTYFRSSNDFQFYKGGSHSNTRGDAGGGTSLFTIKDTGNTGLVGINVVSPKCLLDIYTVNNYKLQNDVPYSDPNYATEGNGFFFNIWKNSSNNSSAFWGLRWHAASNINNNVNVLLYMMDEGTEHIHAIGRFENDNYSTGDFFTGQHRNIVNKNIDESYVGLIVSSTGHYINVDNSLKPSINESLPVCNITNIDNDIKVFGVISDKEDSDDNRSVGDGCLKTIKIKTNKNEQRLHINSVGEGSLWVCNKNGNIQNGDYVSSSSVSGYGQKQILQEGTLKNYTVAKITCDCDFSLTKIVKQKLKLILTTETYETTVTEKVEKSKTETKIVYDEILKKYVQKEITKTITEHQQLYDIVDLYNETGEVIGTHKIERKETKTRTLQNIDYDDNGDVQYEDDLDENGNQQMIYPYDTRFLLPDGTQITEEEYKTKLQAGEEVYIACFVGCTYHCG